MSKKKPRGGPTGFKMISVDAYMTLTPLTNPKVQETMRAKLVKQSRRKVSCEVCGQPAWKLGDCGMCFPCTTGESDASDDYELIEEPK